MSTINTIKCPNCATAIDIDEIFYHQIEEKFKTQQLQEKKKHEEEVELKRSEYKKAFNALKAEKEAISDEKAKYEKELIKETEARLEEQLRLEKHKLQVELIAKITAEREDEIKLMSEELHKKSEQVKELHMATAEVAKLKREKDELGAKAKVEAELELNKRLAEEKLKLSKAVDEEMTLKLKAKDEQIEQMRRDIESAKRKADQGSMQIQGEALELAIESWLSSQFPFDNIDEVKKGAFGADCVQTIHTRELQNCGVICYESKNTKAWSDGWVTKLKQDMLKVNADIGVLVSSVYPKDMDRMGFVDGIWVCSLDEFKGSVSLLRESLIRVHMTVQREDNKSDKMSLLYNYMTGNEFSMQMKAIVDGFMKMQEELEKEKRSLMASWKRREKTIDGVLVNTTEMYGALQGIAGSSAIVHIDALELEAPEDEEE